MSLDMVVFPLTVDPTNSQKIFAGGSTSSNDNSVAISGKHLIVVGENFSDGAQVVLNDETQKTIADEASPNNSLLGKKVGKRIAHGTTVTIQVKNADGGLSEPFRFTRN